MAAAAQLGLATEAAAEQCGPDGLADGKPVFWDAFPSSDDLQTAYPRDASAYNMSGQAEASCNWNEAGKITHCDVVSEKPKSFGFGDASARVAKAHGHLDWCPGQPHLAGKGKTVIIFWSIGR
ncbi:MAG: hypothetical protein WDN06_00700 [Asticcacaulis sp.]